MADGAGRVSGRLVAALAGAAVVGVGAAVLRRRWPRTPTANPYPAPAGMREVVVDAADGGTLRRLEGGPADGRPLVLLHGITLRSEVWRHQFAFADEGFRVIAPDLRGHGGSTAGSRGLGLDGHADDLADLLVDLDLRGAVVVGHSMGGMTIARMIERRPEVVDERVGGLVFVGSAGRSPVPAIAGVFAPLAGVEALAALIDRPGPERFAAGFAGGAFGRDPDPLDVDFSRWSYADMTAESYLAQAPTLVGWNHLEVIAQRVGVEAASCPSAGVVVGTRDRLTPPVEAEALGQALGVEPVVVRGAGHMVMVERPMVVNDLIRAVAARARR